jgi:hypothetical protein
MKKVSLILSVFIFIFSISCTNSDGHDSSKSLSAKIDGVTKYFNDINVLVVPEDGWTDYYITAKQQDDNTKIITINLEKGVTGNDVIYYIQYKNGTDYYDTDQAPFNTNITENSDLKLVGTFSGNLNDGDGNIVQVTQGVLSINF